MPSIVFDRAAEYYDETRGFPPGEGANIAALISDMAGLTTASRVIEVGVGTGRIALPLSRHSRAVFGIDLSRPMLSRLRAKQTGEAIYPVEGDMSRLPFKSNSFDAAVAVHVFHLVPTWREALRELARVLRPDAPLIHAASGSGTTFDVLWQAWNAEVAPEKQVNVGVPREKIKEFPLDEGWRLAGAERTYEYSYDQTPQRYLDWSQRRVWSATWTLSDEELARATGAMREAIREHFGDPNKPVRVASSFRARAFLPPEAAGLAR
jgi:ubiquinone/menaquinone biosynthesis C-methylase UbiE